ncbi:hypothetical protein ACTXT7_010955 [Hymenolepis weldensis]
MKLLNIPGAAQKRMVKTAHRNETVHVNIGFSVSLFKRSFEKAAANITRQNANSFNKAFKLTAAERKTWNKQISSCNHHPGPRRLKRLTASRTDLTSAVGLSTHWCTPLAIEAVISDFANEHVNRCATGAHTA